MTKKLTPEDLQRKNAGFDLLAEVSHQNLREFVVQQIHKEKYIIRIYSIYQILLTVLFSFLLIRSIILAHSGISGPIIAMIFALLFSFSLLIVIHELLHAAAYRLFGARNISFGYELRKFIFYALADKQVIEATAFRVVALTPFVIVKLAALIGAAIYFNEPAMYFFLNVMCFHSLFCAGDMAMLAFYRLNSGKEIFNFDNRTEGKTYFYTRKNQASS